MSDEIKNEVLKLKETPVPDPVREFLSGAGKHEDFHKQVLENTPQSREHSVEFVPEYIEQNAEAKAIWYKITSELKDMKLLHTADLNALIRYCYASIEWRIANDFIMEKGTKYPVYDTREVKEFDSQSGKYVTKVKNILRAWKMYPEVGQASRLRMELLKIEQEFGMTPIARARIGLALTNIRNGQSDGSDPFNYN